MSQRSKLRPTGIATVLLFAWLTLVATACGRGDGQPGGDPPSSTLRWPAREGATRYRVQAWSGRRLLFEQTVRDTTLTVTPALHRAMAPFPDSRLQVRALDGRGDPLGKVWEGPVQRGS